MVAVLLTRLRSWRSHYLLSYIPWIGLCQHRRLLSVMFSATRHEFLFFAGTGTCMPFILFCACHIMFDILQTMQQRRRPNDWQS
jgi:hypothetical protein